MKIWAQFYSRNSHSEPWAELAGSDQIAYLDRRYSFSRMLKEARSIGSHRFSRRKLLFGFRIYRGDRPSAGFALTANVHAIQLEETI